MNINQEIVNWLYSQRNWLQEAAEQIISKGNISDQDIDKIVALLRSKEGTEVSQNRQFSQLGTTSLGSGQVKILSIKDITGIENLAPRQPLVFGKGNLSVVYGNNGSGKSGYTRILKKACGKPNAETLKSNIFKEKPIESYCVFTLELGEKEISEKWEANSSSVEVMKNFDIFDSSCSSIYLQNEKEASYVPPAIALFDKLAVVCDNIKNRLKNEAESLVSGKPKLPSKFSDTKPGVFYNNLSAKTKDLELKERIEWEEKKEKSLEEINERLSTPDHKKIAKQRRDQIKIISEILNEIKKYVESLNKSSFEKFVEIKEEARIKRQAAKDSAALLSSVSEIDGIGTSSWKALWNAAKDFSIKEAYKDRAFPFVDDSSKCVFCHQPLDINAKNRLTQFENHITGTLEKDAENTEKILSQMVEELPKVPEESFLKTRLQAAALPEEEWLPIFIEAYKEIDATKKELINYESGKAQIFINEDKVSLVNKLAEHLKSLEKQAEQHEKDALSFDREKVEKEKTELEANLWMSQNAEAIKNEHDRLKRINNLQNLEKLTSTKDITMKSGELSTKIITGTYIERFNRELEKLGAKHLKVKLEKSSGVKGKVKHRIILNGTISGEHKPTSILSEGEQRIVTLAAFLADVTGKESKDPFIFDDPISSLDQLFEEKTTDRLIELSKERQVIVFTHRLSFMGLINEKESKANIINISRESWGTGNPGEIPIFGKKPDSALKNLKNDRIKKAKNILSENGNDSYYPLAKAICSDIRILMERIVELVLLADVVQRHRRSVQTLNKINKIAFVKQEDCSFVEKIMTKYSCYEHSQSFESPVEMPSPDELENDIDEIVKWHDEFVGRKN